MAEEKLFEGHLKKYLHSVGVYPAGCPEDKMTVPARGWYIKVWGGGFQKSGIPDMIACIEGQFFGIELKASDGHPSALQLLNIRRIKAAGGIAIILYPSGFEEFKDCIEQILDFKSIKIEKEIMK